VAPDELAEGAAVSALSAFDEERIGVLQELLCGIEDSGLNQ